MAQSRPEYGQDEASWLGAAPPRSRSKPTCSRASTAWCRTWRPQPSSSWTTGPPCSPSTSTTSCS
eukprot:9801579-Lingulodinium_polyedra.AAC.1